MARGINKLCGISVRSGLPGGRIGALDKCKYCYPLWKPATADHSTHPAGVRHRYAGPHPSSLSLQLHAVEAENLPGQSIVTSTLRTITVGSVPSLLPAFPSPLDLDLGVYRGGMRGSGTSLGCEQEQQGYIIYVVNSPEGSTKRTRKAEHLMLSK